MKRNKKRFLALESGSGYRIVDETGAVVPVDEARRRWEAMELDDYNMAFKRLVQFDFDVEAVKAYYARGEAFR